MKMKTLTCPLFLSIALLASIPAAAWVPVSCDERATDVEAIRNRFGKQPVGYKAEWQRYERQVREATPGDHKYVPHPYPRTSQQVFEDFRYGFLHRFVGVRDEVGAWQRKTFDLLQGEAVKYEVERVDNWNPHRCGEKEHLPFYYLVRIYDAGGREVSRAAVDESGLLSIFAELDGQGPLDDPAKIAETVRQRFGVETKPTRAQYATLDGPPVWCSPVMPCVVFESGGEIFIVNHDFFLFAIEPGAPRLSIPENARRPIDPRALSVNAGRQSTPWITVGYEWWEGRLVAIGPRGGPLD